MTVYTEDLKDFQAIKVYNSDGYNIVVKLPSGVFKIGDNEVGMGYRGQVIILENEDVLKSIKIVHKGKRYTKHYQLDNEIISTDEYSSRLLHLTEPYIDEDGEYDFPDLDTEYRVKKGLQELQKYSPVMEQSPDTYEDVDIDLAGEITDTGSEFIKTPLAYGAYKFKNSNLFIIQPYEIIYHQFMEVCKNDDVDYQLSSSNSIRFVKIDGEYVLTGMKESNQKDTKEYFTDLEKARDREKHLREEVSQRIYIHYSKKRLDVVLAKNILGDLESLQRVIEELDVKTKSSQQHRTAKSKCQKIINKVLQIDQSDDT